MLTSETKRRIDACRDILVGKLPQPGDKILDPACGTGGFLVSAYRHILAHSTSSGSTMPGDKLTHDQRQKVYGNLAGYDVDDQMVKLSKVNLFLHGFPNSAQASANGCPVMKSWEPPCSGVLPFRERCTVRDLEPNCFTMPCTGR